MRDLGKLRQRLLVAMGVVGALGAGCSNESGGNGGGADVVSDSGADSITDAGGGDAASDSITDAVADTVTDATTDTTTDAVTDTTADTVTDTTADTAGDASADANLPMDVCSFGKAELTCMSAAQLAYAVDNKWGGGAADAGGSDAGPGLDYKVPPEGCPPMERVFDGCCNPAQAGPAMVADTCCYVFCAGACCGRPLVVDGSARMAAVQTGEGWASIACRADDDDAVAALDATTRAALARAWGEVAAMEHASIASFHRFGLELLRFGAPAALVADAARAALDEVDHAERAFDLASLLHGAPQAPAALELGTSVLLAESLEAAIALAVVEGCVGETLAAALAGEAARVAKAEPARAALQVIAADEARHAELAWRFVRWAIERDPAAQAARCAAAAAAFTEALARLPEATQPAGVDAAAWARWGQLAPQHFRAAVLATAREVIAPCARALVGEACDLGFDRAPQVMA